MISQNFREKFVKIVEISDDILHLLVSFFLVLLALILLVRVAFIFSRMIRGVAPPSHTVITALEDIMLVLIMTELLWLVLSYLKNRTLTVEPFIFVGIISGIRKLLVIGATSFQELTKPQLTKVVVEMLAYIFVVFMLIVALYLIRKSRKLYITAGEESGHN